MSLDVSADVTSFESLSFSGLVCIQNQHLTPQTGYGHLLPRARKASQEFEFSHATEASITAFSTNNYMAENMFSNGHLWPHDVPFGSSESRMAKQTSSKRMPLVQNVNGRSEITKQTSEELARISNTGVRNRTDKNQTSGRQRFGQRIFKSFTKPCQDCRTIGPIPSVREQLQQGDK